MLFCILKNSNHFIGMKEKVVLLEIGYSLEIYQKSGKSVQHCKHSQVRLFQFKTTSVLFANLVLVQQR